LTLHPAVFNRDILAFDVAGAFQSFTESRRKMCGYTGAFIIYPTTGISLPRADDDDPTLIEKIEVASV
jgi:hypothetical protein